MVEKAKHVAWTQEALKEYDKSRKTKPYQDSFSSSDKRTKDGQNIICLKISIS